MNYLGCDLGAESGRLILGKVTQGKLEMQELHRFPNVPLRQNDSLVWDIKNLFDELVVGLRRATELQLKFHSISTDSWGVDYVLIDEQGALLPPVYHYRDERTERGVENILKKIAWENIFEETGIQFLSINTLFQLGAENNSRLKKARKLLGVADAFNFFLSGNAKVEESMASTFQIYNPRTRAWSEKLATLLELPSDLLPPIVPAGTHLGSLRPELRSELNMPHLQVIASCSHDTGAAVAAVPAATKSGWGYISSGTWSLMGVELQSPLINTKARELNFTNGAGIIGTTRFLKNIVGLWLLQECRRRWEEEGQRCSYAELTAAAEAAPAFRSLINPAQPGFLKPGDMPGRIKDFCAKTDQPIPETQGAIVRCIFESLAFLYRRTLQELEFVIGRKLEVMHVVGGGSKNNFLNQLTADALQLPVYAGPTEATAAGNIMVQAWAAGEVNSLESLRETIRRSEPIKSFLPASFAPYEPAWKRFQTLETLGS